MSLINCAECGREISSEAAACPNCGHPVKKEKAALLTKPAGCFIQLIALILILAAGSQWTGPEPNPTKGVLLGLLGIVLVWMGRKTKNKW